MARRFTAGIERRTFRHGPRFQRAADFETEIVMQMRRVMALDAELQFMFARSGLVGRRGLGRLVEMPFLGIGFQRHVC